MLIGANLEDTDIIADPQIAGRLKLITMKSFQCDPEDENSEENRIWQTFLAETEEQLLPYLPAGKPGMLYRDVAGIIWRRTQGYMADLTTLINEATWRAARDGTWKIDPAHLTNVKLSVRATREEVRLGRPES